MTQQGFPGVILWPRLRYELRERDGIAVLVAASGGGVQYYAPLIPKKEIMRRPKWPEEHNEATPHLDLARLDASDPADVLRFVNTWGLLGLWAIPAYQAAESLPLKGQATNLGGEKYSTWYYDRRKRARHRHQEPLPLFVQAVHDYQEILREVTHISEAGDQTFTAQLRFNERLKGIRPAASWDEESRKWSAGWQFRSLLDAIYLLTFLDLLGGKAFRRCAKKRCGSIYLTDHPDNQYCSETCRKAHQIQRSRERKWTEDIVKSYPNIDQGWLAEQIERALEQGASGEKRLAEKVAELVAEMQRAT